MPEDNTNPQPPAPPLRNEYSALKTSLSNLALLGGLIGVMVLGLLVVLVLGQAAHDNVDKVHVRLKSQRMRQQTTAMDSSSLTPPPATEP